MSSYMMTSLIGRYEQSFHLLHEQTKHISGGDQLYKEVHSSATEKSSVSEKSTLHSDSVDQNLINLIHQEAVVL